MDSLTPFDILVLALGAIGAGLYVLAKCGDWAVDGAVYVARHLGVAPMVIGFTILAFGTSLPELFVSLNANLSGFPGISLGNVIGSNIANILLVLGVTALLFPVVAERREVLPDLTMMMLATVLLLVFMALGIINRWEGLGLVLFLAAYVFWRYQAARKGRIHAEEPEEPEFSGMRQATLALLTGLAGIALGSELLVRGASAFAGVLGIPESVIGMTVIAFGTSVPELSVCVAAARKHHTEMVVGNILGSNVFNILAILGITALAKPLAIDPALADTDMVILGGVSIGFALVLLGLKRIGFALGLLMVAGYVAFIAKEYWGLLYV